jgi:hypothetical protein
MQQPPAELTTAPAPIPEGLILPQAEALIATLADTSLKGKLEDLPWATVNLFHRAAHRVQRALDANEDAQKRRTPRSAARRSRTAQKSARSSSSASSLQA